MVSLHERDRKIEGRDVLFELVSQGFLNNCVPVLQIEKNETAMLENRLDEAHLEENHVGGVVRAMSKSYGAVLSVMGSRKTN